MFHVIFPSPIIFSTVGVVEGAVPVAQAVDEVSVIHVAERVL